MPHLTAMDKIRRFLINRDFALLCGGQAVSILGDWVFNLTLILWVATRIAPNQPWAVSGVLLAASIPTLVIGPVAGVFVDRWDKRRTMLTMDALRAGLITALILLSGSIPTITESTVSAIRPLGEIYGIVALCSTCGQFFGPARLALIGDIVAEPDRPRASSLELTTAYLALVVGPAISAPLFFGFGVQWALAVNALSFLVSFLAVLAIQAPPAAGSPAKGQPSRFLGEFVAGLQFFKGNRILRTILVSIVLAILGFGALDALNIFFVTRNLHAPARFFSLTTTALGVGGIIGAVLAGLFAVRLGVVRTFWLSIVALGIIVLVYSRQTSFGPALVLVALLGIPNSAANVTLGPIMLHVTPRGFIGRVSGVLMPVISAASTISIAAAGFLAGTVLHGLHTRLLGSTWGPVDSIFTGTGLLTVAGGWYAMINLRGITLNDDSAALFIPAEGNT
jgi:MFS family permease